MTTPQSPSADAASRIEYQANVREKTAQGLSIFSDDATLATAAREAFGDAARVIDASKLVQYSGPDHVGIAADRNPHPTLCVLGLSQVSPEHLEQVAADLAERIKFGLNVMTSFPLTPEGELRAGFEPLQKLFDARDFRSRPRDSKPAIAKSMTF